MTALFDLKGAARLLSVSTWTLRARVKTQQLIPVRIGKRILFEESELQRFVNESKSRHCNSSVLESRVCQQ